MSYVIRKTRSDEDPIKVKMMMDEFFSSNPLRGIFELDEHSPPPPDRPAHREDFNVTAEDSEGRIIGLAMIRGHTPSRPADTPIPSDDVIGNLFSFLEVDAKLNEMPDHTMELAILVVRDGWRQCGVARRLAEESMRGAREAGFTAMKICCTSEYTARLVRSLGWREHYRLAYRDYPILTGRQDVIRPYQPHENIYYYFIEL